MLKNELIERLAAIPGNDEVVIDIGGTEPDVLEITRVGPDGHLELITLKPDPLDLQDALTHPKTLGEESRL